MHKLHIFAKNRDAVAAQKGYSFQQLKTLEDWIENRIAGGDEDIYCDFEDDIFSRDLSQSKVTFKQIKLYSTDFSFSSESITKAIAHFFSLYTKGEYSFDDAAFLFETNVSVVGRTIKDNDAALLDEWDKNQNDLSQDLLQRIRVRVKKILDEYVEDRVDELKERVELKSELQTAKNIYDNLNDEDFNAFIKCIKWQFDGEESNEAVANLLGRIEELIPKIPLPLDSEKTNIYSSLLVSEVFLRSIQDDQEDRKLTKDLLDAVLLNAGKKEDKWYAEAIQQVKEVVVKDFYPGEFQTVVSAANYCRWNKMDEGHKLIWLGMLKQYIDLADTPVANKRKAIYEYLFLKIGHDLLLQRTVSPIADDIELINYYIANWKPAMKVQNIEDDIVILQLAKSQIKRFQLPFSPEHLSSWEDSIKKYLAAEAAKEQNIDRLCEILEIQGHLAHQLDINDPIKGYTAAFEYYRKIPPLLEKAHFYSLARLYAQLQQMAKMLIKYKLNDQLLGVIDEFSGEIQEYAEKTGLRHKAAHEMVERGTLHLEHHDLHNYMQALELFQKAKAKWRIEHTKEGYILSLLGIASVYEGLGMTFAGKYYALLAFWNTWHSVDPGLYKYLPKALYLAMQADYKHGAWVAAVCDFEVYLFAKREFDEKGFDMDGDEHYHHALLQMTTILHAIPLIHPPMKEFIESIKTSLGFVWTEQIEPLIEEISKGIPDIEALKQRLNYNLNDVPLNDIGPFRHIRFKTLGNSWHIQFANSETITPVGEEFISFLQITLCEIARLNPGILNPGKEISIEILKGHFQKKLVNEDNWIITIPEFDSKEQLDIQRHYAYIGSLVSAILQHISTATKEEFTTFYLDELLKKGKLGDKALEATSYQRVFRNTVGATSEFIKQRTDLDIIPLKDFNKTFRDWLTIKK